MAKKIRGKVLDELLPEILKEMLKNGYKVSPISMSTVRRRLDLKSRSTLLKDGRKELIERARIQQLHEAGLNPDKKKRRSTLEEQIASLKKQLVKVESERNSLIEKLEQIVSGLQAKGLDVEKFMLPLRPNYKSKKLK